MRIPPSCIGTEGIDFVAFTGSVAGGHAVVRGGARSASSALAWSSAARTPPTSAPTPTLDHAVENLVDGAFFNSGQSCCGIERIYVHKDVYNDFVDGFVALTREIQARQSPGERCQSRPGGARQGAADEIREPGREIRQGRGASRSSIPGSSRPTSQAPPMWRRRSWSIVDQAMPIMQEECFGPVVGIMPVRLGRRGDPPDERQRLRPDRRDLDQ